MTINSFQNSKDKSMLILIIILKPIYLFYSLQGYEVITSSPSSLLGNLYIQSPFQQASQRSRSPKKWKFCCLKCRQQDKGTNKPKACVCIVPATQRRIEIGQGGCLTCGCRGCSIEDIQMKNKKKKKKQRESSSGSSSSSSSSSEFKVVNGCCKKCMKAFSKNGKSCLCQVPKQVRKKALPKQGCQFCYCHGCHPEDRKNESEQSMSPMSEPEMNLYNYREETLSQYIQINQMYPPLFGIGVPQRTYSYIFGKETPKD